MVVFYGINGVGRIKFWDIDDARRVVKVNGLSGVLYVDGDIDSAYSDGKRDAFKVAARKTAPAFRRNVYVAGGAL
jgi:hypothetical protein